MSSRLEHETGRSGLPTSTPRRAPAKVMHHAGRLRSDRLTADRLTTDRLTTDRLTDDRLTDDQCTLADFPCALLKAGVIVVDRSGNELPLSGQEGICVQ